MAKEFTEEQESSWEIITIQELKELYCDKKQLLEPNYKLYQMATLAGRMYFTVDDNMKFQRAYIGSTNIAKVMKMEDSLLRWWCKQGYEGAYKHMRERSVFGSFWLMVGSAYSYSLLWWGYWLRSLGWVGNWVLCGLRGCMGLIWGKSD